jgi:hypothetical protein
MLGKLFLIAVAFAIVLKYFIIPLLSFLAFLVGRLGVEGGLKHFLVVSLFALLVFSFGVFTWLVARIFHPK